MINRRSFCTTALAAGCACGMPHGAFAAGKAVLAGKAAAPVLTSAGCLVSRADFRRDRLGELGLGGRASGFTVGTERFVVVAKTGNAGFDRAMAEALYQISNTFGVLPTFGFIQGGNVANAFATTVQFTQEPGDAPLPTREHGTVLFGDGILEMMQQRGVQNPVAAVLVICAHEFGHIVQYNYTYENRALIDLLNGDQPTVKRGELHADFLAGYYVGMARRRNPDTPAASIAQAAYVLGDFDVDYRGHHGTPDERGAAVYAGYRASWEQQRPFDEAVVEGLIYVGAAS